MLKPLLWTFWPTGSCNRVSASKPTLLSVPVGAVETVYMSGYLKTAVHIPLLQLQQWQARLFRDSEKLWDSVHCSVYMQVLHRCHIMHGFTVIPMCIHLYYASHITLDKTNQDCYIKGKKLFLKDMYYHVTHLEFHGIFGFRVHTYTPSFWGPRTCAQVARKSWTNFSTFNLFLNHTNADVWFLSKLAMKTTSPTSYLKTQCSEIYLFLI